MRQFQVPQFITIEDKVVGPLTVKQAVYLGVGATLAFFSCSFFAQFLCVSTAVPIGAIALSLAFMKINEQPFAVVLKNLFFFLIRPRRYIWKKLPPEKVRTEAQTKKPKEVLISAIPKLSASRLSDLAWSLDIKHEHEDTNNERI